MKKSTSTRKLFIGLTLAASLFAMTLPIVATVSNSEYGEGYIPPQGEVHQPADSTSKNLLSDTSYPSSYDSRDQSWWKGIEVKNQRITGLCWAFASCSASEISYAKEYNKTAIKLSPGHLGYFSYNRASTLTDPLGNTLGDYVGGDSEWYDTGGNADTAVFTLAGRMGYASATTAPYENWVGNPTSFKSYSDSIAYVNDLVLENADYYYISKGEVPRDTIKGLITKYGAVFCSLTGIQSEYCEYKNGYYNLNYDGDGYATHAVTMIGWDDNYSKENFPEEHQPDNDGAWLIQNSWGDSHKYVWVSYEDNCINKDITGFDVREAVENEVVFQHDGTSSWAYKFCSKDDKVANIYSVPSGKNYSLKEIGLGELNDKTTSYNISIYTGLKNRNNPIPTGATPAVSFDVTTTCEGYHTFALPSEVALEGGTYYSIVVTAKKDYTYIAADKSYTVGSVSFNPTTNAGDSFYYESGLDKWTDLSTESKPLTARIKGIAVETGGITFTAATNATGSTSEKTVKLDDTFTVTLSTKKMKAKDIKGGITYDSSVVELVKAEGTNSAGTTAENKFYLKYDHDNDASTAMIEKTFTGTKSTGKYEFSAEGAADCTHAAKSDFVTFTFKAKKAGDANIKLYEETSGTDEVNLSNVNPGFTVTVENALKSIAVTSPPTKTKYCAIASQTFNKSGMVVTATYLDGTTKDVTSNCTYSPTTATKLTTSNTAITISYTENGVTKTTTQAITVVNHDYVLNTSQSGTSGTGWKWTNYTKATAYVKCSLCNATDNGNATITNAVTKNPTCTTTGETTYTATYTATNGQVFTTTKVNTSSPGVTSHDYTGATPSWTWSGYTSATAKFKCNNCTHTETKTATIGSKVTTEPSCTTTGVRTYTATVTFNNKQYTDTKTETIAAGHTMQTKSLVKATTSADGNIACYYCSACKKYFSDQAGTKEITDGSWKINKIASVTLGTTSYYYDNTEKKPTVTVKDSAGKELSSINDYSVTYTNNINPGTATATITFKGNYSGTVEKTFEIKNNNTISGTVVGYTGSNLVVLLRDASGNEKSSTTTSFSFDKLSNGTYTLTAFVDGDYIPHEYSITIQEQSVKQDITLCQPGDANCDGELSAEDVTRIARHLAKIDEESEDYKLKLFDTDRSDTLSAEDVTNLARYLAKITDTLTISENAMATVPSLYGKSVYYARLNILKAGLKIGNITESYKEGATIGTVIWQQYAANSSIKKGTSLDFEVAKEKNLD